MGNSRARTMASILLICFALATISSVRAEYSVGVQGGDWIQYRLKASTSVGTTETKIIDNWVKITINNVTGTSILLTIESDQSGWTPQNFTEDVASDCQLNLLPTSLSTDVLMTNLFIVPANLSASGNIPTGSSYTTVKDITQHSGHDSAHYDMSLLGMGTYDVWWDRPTGMLLEYKYTVGVLGASYTASVTVESTNMWSTPMYWLLPVIIAVIIVVVVAVALLVLRGRKRAVPSPAQQPPPPPPPPPTEFIQFLTRTRAMLNSILLL
jgi:hypothetical protein